MLTDELKEKCKAINGKQFNRLSSDEQETVLWMENHGQEYGIKVERILDWETRYEIGVMFMTNQLFYDDPETTESVVKEMSEVFVSFDGKGFDHANRNPYAL